MFNRKFKLISQAVGLVAVLVMMLALPGVTQENPLTRKDITTAVSNALQTFLTAATEVLLDPERVSLLSDTAVTIGFIPISKVDEPRVTRLLADILDGKGGSATIGAIYISEPIKVRDAIDGREVSLSPGLYRVKVTDKDKAVLVDNEGNGVVTARVEMEKYPLAGQDKIARGITIATHRIIEEAPKGIEFIRTHMVLSESPPAYSADTVSSIANDRCSCVAKILLAIAAIIAAI